MTKFGIYKIVCADYRKVYIGQTESNVEVCLGEHQMEEVLTENKGATVFQSRLTAHMAKNNRVVSWEDVRVVKHGRDTRKLDGGK